MSITKEMLPEPYNNYIGKISGTIRLPNGKEKEVIRANLFMDKNPEIKITLPSIGSLDRLDAILSALNGVATELRRIV